MTLPFFITGAGTEIGKTLVTTSLCWQLKQRGHQVTALKPVITGYDAKDDNNDAALILKSCGVTASPAGSVTGAAFAAFSVASSDVIRA